MTEPMKKIVSAALCLVLALTLCACGGDKDDASGAKNEKAKETVSDAREAAPAEETKESEEEPPEEAPAAETPPESAPKEETPPEDASPASTEKGAEVKTAENAAAPVGPEDVKAASEAAASAAALFAALDFEGARELTLEGSQAYEYFTSRCGGSPEALMGPSTYLKIKTAARLADVDVNSPENQERLVTYALRMKDYISYTSGEAVPDGGKMRAEFSVIMPELNIGAAYNAVEAYLASLGSDIDSVRAQADAMSPDEKAAYEDQLISGFADYALNGGMDMSATEELQFAATLEKSGGKWLITGLEEITPEPQSPSGQGE